MKEVKILCEDGFELAGSIYQPDSIKAAIMIAPATGIKRQFYNSFASYFAEQGYGILTFDNRGIGDSKGESINGVGASLVNWGILDMTAALEKLKQQFPNTEYHVIGHSAGGQLVGMMKNAKELKSIFNFGSSSGSIHFAKYPFKFLFSFFMNFFIPVSNFLFGHTKSQWVGMGEPLPKEVANDWRRFCNGKGYIKVELDKKTVDHLYDELSISTMWVFAQDDDIVNIGNIKDMIRVYSKINSKTLELIPKEHGFKDIGHMKFFSSKRKSLWSLAFNWMEEFNQE